MIKRICDKMKEKIEKLVAKMEEEVRLFGNIFGSAVGIIEDYSD
jgi:hypothetical protein